MQSLKTVNYAYRQTDVHLDHSSYYKILIKYIVYCIVLYCIVLHCTALHCITLVFQQPIWTFICQLANQVCVK